MCRACIGLAAILVLLSALSLESLSAFRPHRSHGAADVSHASGDWANTFSIVAYDPEKKEWGVAVASKYLAVGSAVPFSKAGVGAVAPQSFVNVELGPRGLDLMGPGKSAEEAPHLPLAEG